MALDYIEVLLADICFVLDGNLAEGEGAFD